MTRGTGVLGTTAESYSYDALDRILTAVDDDYQVELTWDSVSNLLQDRQGYTVQGQEKWKAVQVASTDAGSTASITYPSAFQVSHTRDAGYRLQALTDVGASATIASFTWQGGGRLATTSNQNGTGTDYTWDGFRRISEIDQTLSGGASLHKFEYAYDKVHNRRMEKNSFDATWVATLPQAVQGFLNGRGGKGDVYAYDMAYRMVDARYDVTNPLLEVQTPGSQAYGKLVQYTMDGLGNRSQVQTTPPTPPAQVMYSTDVVNQYTQVGGVNRTHDSNGNLTDDGTYLFGYDFQNRLVRVTNKRTQTVIADYRFDALGRRVEKAVNGGATTRYLLDGVQVVEEYDGSDAWQARYVYEDGIDQPRCMDRADIADVDGDQNTTEVLRFHYHQQALGCVTEMSEPGGAVVEWVTYDVYGLPTIRDMQGTQVSQSAIGNPYLYTGREYDPESGLYFYRARHYDPATGRFLQRDPSGYVDGGSLYVYTRSRSPCARDPRGLESEEVERARAEYDEAAAEVGRLEDERDHLKAEDDEAIDRYLELVRESVLSPEPANADPDLPSMKDQIAGAADDMQKVLDENATRQAELLDEIDAAKRRRALALNALMRAKGLEESAAQAGAQLRAPAQPPSPYPDGIPVEIWLRKDGRWHLLVAGVRSGGVFEIYVGPCPPGFTGFPGPEPRKGPWEPEPETPWPPDFAKPSAPSGPERWR